jgi:hypothetical protein
MTIPVECLTKEQVRGREFRFDWGFGADPIYRVAEQLIGNMSSYYKYKYVHSINNNIISFPVESAEEAWQMYQDALAYFKTPAGSWYWDDDSCSWSTSGLNVWDEDLKDWTTWYKDQKWEEGEFPDCFEEEE